MLNKFLIILLILSCIVALYLSIGVMLIGGIIQITQSISPFVASGVAIGIIKILFFELPFIIPYIVYIIIACIKGV